MSFQQQEIGTHVLSINKWNPTNSNSDHTFSYIDLSSVDKDKKCIELSNVPTVHPLKAPSRARQIVSSHDVLVSTVRPNLNGIASVPQDLNGATASTGYCVLRANNKTLNSSYLYYWVQTDFFVKDMVSKASGANYPAVSDKIIKKSTIPLPPLAEQKQIAAILDVADSLRQKDQQLIDHYTALSQSLFLELFGDPVTNPKKWEQVKLKDACNKVTDGTHHSPSLVKTGKSYVTAKHVKESGLEFLSKATYISEKDHDEIYKRCNPEYGDVLYIKDGATTGLACINSFHEEISLLSSLALLKLKSEMINNHYLCFWLNHGGIKNKLLNEYMSGAAIQRYTLTKINTFKLMLPPIKLQNQFAERIAIIEQQKQQAQASLEKSEALFNSLLQRAFKGELT